MKTRQIKPDLKTLRQEMITNVRAFNKYLHEAVKKMDWHQLLCNCHPVERSDFAWRLYKKKEIDWDTLQNMSLKKIQ